MFAFCIIRLVPAKALPVRLVEYLEPGLILFVTQDIEPESADRRNVDILAAPLSGSAIREHQLAQGTEEIFVEARVGVHRLVFEFGKESAMAGFLHRCHVFTEAQIEQFPRDRNPSS